LHPNLLDYSFWMDFVKLNTFLSSTLLKNLK